MKKLIQLGLVVSAIFFSVTGYADCNPGDGSAYPTVHCAANPYNIPSSGTMTPGSTFSLVTGASTPDGLPFINPSVVGPSITMPNPTTTLPSGSTLNFTQAQNVNGFTLSGTIASNAPAGKYTAKIFANNSNHNGTVPYEVNFNVLPLPTINIPNQTGYINQPYNLNFSQYVTNFQTITLGSPLPDGLKLSCGNPEACQISGTPTATFNNDIALTATNTSGSTKGKFHLSITTVPPAITTTPIADQTATVGQPFKLVVAPGHITNATDITFDPNSQALLNKAGGLSFGPASTSMLFGTAASFDCSNGENCVLQGTPSAQFDPSHPTQELTLVANNNGPQGNVLLPFNMTINPAPLTPVVSGDFSIKQPEGISLSYDLTSSSNPSHSITNATSIIEKDPQQLLKYGLGLVQATDGASTGHWFIQGTPSPTTPAQPTPLKLELYAQNSHGKTAIPATLLITPSTPLPAANITQPFIQNVTIGKEATIALAPDYVQNADLSNLAKSIQISNLPTGLVVKAATATNGVVVGATISGTATGPWVPAPTVINAPIQALGIGQTTPTTGTLSLTLNPAPTPPTVTVPDESLYIGQSVNIPEPGILNAYGNITDVGPNGDTLSNHGLSLTQSAETGQWTLTGTVKNITTNSQPETFTLTATNPYSDPKTGTGTFNLTITQPIGPVPNQSTLPLNIAGYSLIPTGNDAISVSKDFTPNAETCTASGSYTTAGFAPLNNTCTFTPSTAGGRYPATIGSSYEADVTGSVQNQAGPSALKTIFTVTLGTYTVTNGLVQGANFDEPLHIVATDLNDAGGLTQYNLGLKNEADGWHLYSLNGGVANGGDDKNTTGKASIAITSKESPTQNGVINFNITSTTPQPNGKMVTVNANVCDAGKDLKDTNSTPLATALMQAFTPNATGGCAIPANEGQLPPGLSFDTANNCALTGNISPDALTGSDSYKSGITALNGNVPSNGLNVLTINVAPAQVPMPTNKEIFSVPNSADPKSPGVINTNLRTLFTPTAQQCSLPDGYSLPNGVSLNNDCTLTGTISGDVWPNTLFRITGSNDKGQGCEAKNISFQAPNYLWELTLPQTMRASQIQNGEFSLDANFSTNGESGYQSVTFKQEGTTSLQSTPLTIKGASLEQDSKTLRVTYTSLISGPVTFTATLPYAATFVGQGSNFSQSCDPTQQGQCILHYVGPDDMDNTVRMKKK